MPGEATDICGPNPTTWAKDVQLKGQTALEDKWSDSKVLALEGARSIYKDAICSANSRLRAESDPAQQGHMKKAIVETWINYAGLEKCMRQFKQASVVYTQAAENDAVRSSPIFWNSYLDYSDQRDRNHIPENMSQHYLAYLESCSSRPSQSAGGENDIPEDTTRGNHIQNGGVEESKEPLTAEKTDAQRTAAQQKDEEQTEKKHTNVEEAVSNMDHTDTEANNIRKPTAEPQETINQLHTQNFFEYGCAKVTDFKRAILSSCSSASLQSTRGKDFPEDTTRGNHIQNEGVEESKEVLEEKRTDAEPTATQQKEAQRKDAKRKKRNQASLTAPNAVASLTAPNAVASHTAPNTVASTNAAPNMVASTNAAPNTVASTNAAPNMVASTNAAPNMVAST